MEEGTDGITESAVRAATDLRAVVSRLRRRLQELSTQGFTPSQMSVLSRLDKEGPRSASALAAAERVRPQSMAAILAALAQQGLIQRSPDPADGRRQLVSLSEAGRERLHGDRQTRQEWLVRALQERYSDAERRTVIEALALLDRLNRP